MSNELQNISSYGTFSFDRCKHLNSQSIQTNEIVIMYVVGQTEKFKEKKKIPMYIKA